MDLEPDMSYDITLSFPISTIFKGHRKVLQSLTQLDERGVQEIAASRRTLLLWALEHDFSRGLSEAFGLCASLW